MDKICFMFSRPKSRRPGASIGASTYKSWADNNRGNDRLRIVMHTIESTEKEKGLDSNPQPLVFGYDGDGSTVWVV